MWAIALSQKEVVEGAVKKTNGNQTEAARLLKITTSYLRHLIGKLEIQLPS